MTKLNYIAFIIISAAAIFYVFNLPDKNLFVLVPWALALFFFVMWRMGYRSETKKSPKRKIKRYR